MGGTNWTLIGPCLSCLTMSTVLPAGANCGGEEARKVSMKEEEEEEEG